MSGALDSLLAQTYPHWECIIVNDGSQDQTEEVAQAYVRQDARFVYVYQSNAGASTARNTGIRRARGKYIQFLDADDMLESQKFEKQIQILEGNPHARITFSDVKVFRLNQEGHFVFDARSFDVPRISSTDPAFGPKLLKGPFTINSPLINRAVFDEIGMFDTLIKSNEDWDLWLRMMIHGETFLYAPEKNTFSLVRVHLDNHTHNKGWLVFTYRLKIRDRLRHTLADDRLRQVNEQLIREEQEILVHIALDALTKNQRSRAIGYFFKAAWIGRKPRYILYALLSPFAPLKLYDRIIHFSFRKPYGQSA
ncbi:MAG: glycosyltransferase family 2 protein [Bacteroidia bacterium]|nr:glycosyltransferase family 2 protein [Bacteroidia bacterium]